MTVGSVKAMAAPKGTPPEILQYLTDRLKKLCEDPEFVKAMKDIGQPVMYLPPQECVKFLKDGSDQYGKLIKEFNIKLE